MAVRVESAEHSSPELRTEGDLPAHRAEPREAARKPVRKVPYLSKRQGRYFFVRRYPQRLLAQGCFTEPTCRVALNTADRLDAEVAARRLAANFDRAIADFDAQFLASPALETAKVSARLVLADDVAPLARRFGALLLHSDDVDRSEKLSPEELVEYVGQVEAQRSQLRLANACGDHAAVADDVRGFLEAEKLECPEGTEVWKGLLREMMLAQLNALRGIMERLEGQERPTPLQAVPLRSEGDLDDLDRAFAHWESKARPTGKTLIEARSIFRRLKSYTGKSRISTLTREELLAFQKEEGKRMVRDCLVRPQTVNKMMGLLRAIFSLVCDDLLSDRGVVNPLHKMRKERVKSSDIIEKQDLSSEQLGALFTGPVHSKQQRPLGGGGEASYWLPILGYTTGARMRELAQLSVHEVVVRDGVICLWVTNRDDREQAELHQLSEKQRLQLFETSLKTGASRRIIPVHPDVLSRGFMDYVEHVRASGSHALFPDIRPDCKGNLAGNYSKWFNLYLARVGIKRRGLDWISFRHTLKTLMREARIEQEVRDYLEGHTSERAAQNYGRFPPAMLLAEVKKLSFPILTHVPIWRVPSRRPELFE
jgi:integrase